MSSFGQGGCDCCLRLPGTLTVEQIYQDRDKFATLVREVAAPDVGRMGIEILSFTIKVRGSCTSPRFADPPDASLAAANGDLRPPGFSPRRMCTIEWST